MEAFQRRGCRRRCVERKQHGLFRRRGAVERVHLEALDSLRHEVQPEPHPASLHWRRPGHHEELQGAHKDHRYAFRREQHLRHRKHQGGLPRASLATASSTSTATSSPMYYYYQLYLSSTFFPCDEKSGKVYCLRNTVTHPFPRLKPTDMYSVDISG